MATAICFGQSNFSLISYFHCSNNLKKPIVYRKFFLILCCSRCSIWSLNRRFTTRRPTHYLLDYYDFNFDGSKLEDNETTFIKVGIQPTWTCKLVFFLFLFCIIIAIAKKAKNFTMECKYYEVFTLYGTWFKSFPSAVSFLTTQQ